MSQPDPRAENRRRPHWTFVSIALFLIALLILIPTGLCAALVGILAIIENNPEAILTMLVFAALPLLVGGVLIYAALKARTRD